jgi:histidyl-tRNA synthetase
LRLNHRGLLRALMESAGVPGDQEGDAIAAIDKLDMVGADGVLNELTAKGVAEPARRRLVETVTQAGSLESIAKLVSKSELGRKACEDIQSVLDLSDNTPTAGRLRFDPTLARGLEYYTGCIFEIAVADLNSSLGGGGRYDNLIGMFLGKSVPACGFSLGLERLLVVMQERGLFPEGLSRLDVALGFLDEGERREALRLGHLLREAGYRVDLRPDVAMPGKLRKEADERAVRFAVWLERGARGKASLWSRSDARTSPDLSFNQIIELLKKQS